MFDMGPYYLTALVNLVGPIHRVSGSARTTFPERTITSKPKFGEKITVETPDISMIQLDFGNNSYAQILSSFAVPGSQAPAMEVHGSDASLTIWLDDWYSAAGPIDYIQRDPSPAGLSGWQKRVGPPSPIGHPGENLIWSGPRHFVSVLNGTQQPILTAEHAIHILDIILSSAESASSGKAIELNTSF